MSIADFPQADADALALSGHLQARIRAELAAHEGHMDFARFMQMALYEPGFGYYSAGARKFGESGDFITAPEVSSLFSICLARQCLEVLRELGEGAVILELGAGTGVMAADILQELAVQDCMPARYLILEPSADLRQRQQDLLASRVPALLDRISWLDSLPAEPLRGLVLANEVLDAMPVQRFRVHKDGIRSMHVVETGDKFTWHDYPAEAELLRQVETIRRHAPEDLAEGYSSELNTQLPVWLHSLSDCLQAGVMLFIDYGYSRHEYYHPQRYEGTLLCHYRHRAHNDPFIHIGLQDITASVDFTALAEAAVDCGLRVEGFTSQAFFLLACGLQQLLQDKPGLSTREQIELNRQIKVLTLPAEMGERFKVMALSREMETRLSGFSLIDHRRRL